MGKTPKSLEGQTSTVCPSIHCSCSVLDSYGFRRQEHVGPFQGRAEGPVQGLDAPEIRYVKTDFLTVTSQMRFLTAFIDHPSEFPLMPR